MSNQEPMFNLWLLECYWNGNHELNSCHSSLYRDISKNNQSQQGFQANGKLFALWPARVFFSNASTVALSPAMGRAIYCPPYSSRSSIKNRDLAPTVWFLVRHVVNCVRSIWVQFTTLEIKTRSRGNLSAVALGSLDAGLLVRSWKVANQGNVLRGLMYMVVTTNSTFHLLPVLCRLNKSCIQN